MKNSEFNKLLKKITTKNRLDVKKIPLLTLEEREAIIRHIVRRRGAIVKDLIPEFFDFSWLFSCGYLYETAGKEYVFIHTSEHSIK